MIDPSKLEEIGKSSGIENNVPFIMNKKSFSFLAETLSEGEDIKCVAYGISNNKSGFIAVSNKRVVFCSYYGGIFGLGSSKVIEEIELSKIINISYNEGLVFGEITVNTSGYSIAFKQIAKKNGFYLQKTIKESLNN